MASTLSSWAELIKEQVLTINASASVGSLVISNPSAIKEPSITSASTRFFAHPSEIIPTREGEAVSDFLWATLGTGRRAYPKRNDNQVHCERAGAGSGDSTGS